MTKIINEIQKIKSHSQDIKLGISEANKTEINAINEVYPLTFVKNDYSILNYSYEEEMKLCVSKGIHFFASSPFKNYLIPRNNPPHGGKMTLFERGDYSKMNNYNKIY